MSAHAEAPSPLDALARDISINAERPANGNPSVAAPCAAGGDRRDVPAHVAIIMDGNGRWATRRGRERTFGHAAGESAILAAIDAALDSEVRWLTLYAFSTENWNRPEDEVAFLMDFNRRLIEKHGERYHARGVRFRYQGLRCAPIPEMVIAAIDQIEQTTSDADSLTLTFAFNYGGRAEIVAACQKLIREGADADGLDERRFEEALQFPDAPPPDVIVRTAGEHRLSNFLLWQAAYAELIFLGLSWPDFGTADFHDILETYARRTRTFGTIPREGVSD